MKKAIALFLALVSLVTISVPAHAAPADHTRLEETAPYYYPLARRKLKYPLSTKPI